MNPLPFILLAISLPLLLGGCGEKITVEPVAEVKTEIQSVNQKETEIRNDGILYLKGSDLPYSGKTFRLHIINGQKESEIIYKDGKKEGLKTVWYDNGQKWFANNYKDDRLNGLATGWHRNGQKSSEVNFKNDIRNGSSIEWFANGKKLAEQNFKNGKLVGPQKYWNNKGESVDSYNEAVAKSSPPKPTKVKELVNSNSKQSEVVLIDSDLWYVVKDGTVKIIQNRSGGLLGTPGTRLPETIDGKPVTSIGSKAYAGTSQRVFIIPDTVTDVGEEAFADCYATLHEVKIGKNVKSIGKGAFRFSMPLKSITIPGSVVNIGEEAFFGCRTLADITLEEGVTSIGEKAFVNTYIKGITIPKSIKSVGKDAFESCTRLTTVTFLGDAPEEVGRVFSSKVIIYRKPEAKGWGDTWGGKPVKLISEKP